MGRIHAFEVNDTAFFPRFLRESIVETLGLGLRWGHIYDAVSPLFASFIERAGVSSVLDIGTGTGEPASILLGALERAGLKAPRFVLSDLFPNETALERVAARHPGMIEIVRTPVDATNVPPAVDQPARMVISAFHHFTPELARRLLADSVAKRRPIFILEAFPRKLRRVVSVLPAMTAAIFANPFLCGHDRLLKLVFTFLIPIIPIAGFFDAVVSVLRIHSESELRAFVEPLGGGFVWECHEVRFFPFGRAMVFLGVPGHAVA
jgi:hypothetical protein